MHDDEEEDVDNSGAQPLGRLHRAGFQPDAGRADYALPEGEAALQDRWLEEEEPDQGPETTPSRRRLLAYGVAAGLAIATGGALGSRWLWPTEPRRREPWPASPTPPPPAPDLPGWARILVEGARGIADGPVDDLVAAYPTYAMVVERFARPDDAELWLGIERLADFAVLDRSEKGRRIARRLRQLFDVNPPPVSLLAKRAALDALLRSRELRRK